MKKLKLKKLMQLLALIIMYVTIYGCEGVRWTTPKYEGPPRPEYDVARYIFGNYSVNVQKVPPEYTTNNLAYFLLIKDGSGLTTVYLHKDKATDVNSYAEFEKMNLPEKRAFIRRTIFEKAKIDIGQ